MPPGKGLVERCVLATGPATVKLLSYLLQISIEPSASIPFFVK